MPLVKRPLRPEEAEWYAQQGIDPNTIEATVEVPDKPSSALAAGARGTASAALPTVAGGLATGATMAATPAIIASLGFAPLTGGASIAVPLLLGLAAGAGAGALTAKGQEAVMPETWKQQLAKDVAEHPVASRVGQVAALPLGGFNPSRDVFRAGTYGVSKLLGAPTTREGAQAALNVGLGSGLGVVQEGAMQAMRGDLDVGQLAESALIGSVFTKRNPLGAKYGFHEAEPFKVDQGNPEFRLGAKQVVSTEKEKVNPAVAKPGNGINLPGRTLGQPELNFGNQLLFQPELGLQAPAEPVTPSPVAGGASAPRTPAVLALEASLKNSGYTGAITPEVLAGWAQVLQQHGVNLETKEIPGAKGMYEPATKTTAPKATIDTSKASVTTTPHELSHHMWTSMDETTRQQLVKRITPDVERINKERAIWNKANPDKQMRPIDPEEYFASEMGVKAAERAAAGENVGFRNWWNDTKAYLTTKYGDPSVGDIYRTELVRLMNAQKPKAGGVTLIAPGAKKEEYGEGIPGLDISNAEQQRQIQMDRDAERKIEARKQMAADREKIGLPTRSPGVPPTSYPEDPFYQANLRAPERRHELGGNDESFFPGEQIPPGEMAAIDKMMTDSFKYHVGRVKAYSDLKRIQADDLNNIKTRVWISLISDGIDKDGLKNSVFRRMNDALNEEITDYKLHRQGKVSLNQTIGNKTTELGDLLAGDVSGNVDTSGLKVAKSKAVPEEKEASPTEAPTTELEAKGTVKEELAPSEQPVSLNRTTLAAIENIQEMREVMVSRAEREMKDMSTIERASHRADLDAKLAKLDAAIQTMKEMPPESKLDINKIMKAMSGKKQEASEDITPPEGYRWVNLVKEGGEKEKVLFNDKYYKGFPGGDRASYARLNPEGKMSHGVSLPGQKIEELGSTKLQTPEEDIVDVTRDIEKYIEHNPDFPVKFKEAMEKDVNGELRSNVTPEAIFQMLQTSSNFPHHYKNLLSVFQDFIKKHPDYVNDREIRMEAERQLKEKKLYKSRADVEEKIREHKQYLDEQNQDLSSPAYKERQANYDRKYSAQGRHESLMDDALDFLHGQSKPKDIVLRSIENYNKGRPKNEQIDIKNPEAVAQRFTDLVYSYLHTEPLTKSEYYSVDAFLNQFPEQRNAAFKSYPTDRAMIEGAQKDAFDSVHDEIVDLTLEGAERDLGNAPVTPDFLHENWETYKDQVKEQNPDLHVFLNNVKLAHNVFDLGKMLSEHRDYTGELENIKTQRRLAREEIQKQGRTPRFQGGEGEDITTPKQERFSTAAEDIDTTRQGFFNMFSSTFDKLQKFSPKLAKAFNKWEAQKDVYEGWGTLAMKDLQKFSQKDVNEVWEAHRTAFRNGTDLPTFSGNKEKISDIFTDYFHDSIGEERRNLGLTINNRTPGKNPAYVPDMLSPKAVDLLVNKPYLPEGKAAAREWAEYIHQQSKGEVSLEDAKEYVKQYTRAMGATTGNYLSVEYGAIRNAEGYGIPESLREKDALSAMSRYSRRAARDLAMFKELETPKEIAAALELNDRTTGATVKHPGVEGISKQPEVKDAMKWVTGEFASTQSALASPKSTAIVRLVNNLIMGPATALRDTATVPLNMVPYLNRFEDLSAALSGISKFRQNARDAIEYGATKPNIDKLQFGDLAQSPDKFTDFTRKAATLARSLQGREMIENFNRDVTFSIGKELARSNIIGAKAGKKSSIDFLKKFGELVDGDITKMEGKQLEDALNKIGKSFTDRNQGTYGGRGLPVWMLDSQFAPFLSLQKWSLEKSNVIWKDVIKPFISGENRLPMLTYALGSVMTGAAIKQLNELLTARKSQDPDWSEVEAAGGPEDYVAKLVSLMQLGSYAGIISDMAKGATDAAVYGKTPRNLVSFPTASLALDLQEKVAFASEAISQGENPAEVLYRLSLDIMSQNVQAARMVANRTWKEDDIERSDKFRDLRVFQQLQGGKQNRFPATNPYLDLDTRLFKRTSNPQEARELAHEIRQKAREESTNHYEFEQRMKSAKTMSYRTVPNRETDPIGYRRYYNYLVASQGQERADEIIADNRRQRRLNARKAAMLP